MIKKTYLEALITCYENSILRFCYLYLLDLEQAQKVVPEVFVRAYSHPDFTAKGLDKKKLLHYGTPVPEASTPARTQCLRMTQFFSPSRV